MTITSDTRPYSSVWSDLAQVEFSQGFVDAEGYRTRYLHAGDRTKPALILLHGVTGHAEAYIRNLAHHAANFSVSAIDLIGHGYSSKPMRALEIPDYIDHVQRFMRTVGISRASFSGESLGGWITARFAQLHPEAVDRIVLNTMGGTMANPAVMQRIYDLTMAAANDPSWERVRSRLEWLMADPSMVTDDLVRTRQAIFQQPNWPHACEMTLALQHLDIRRRNMLGDADLEAIEAPALVIWTSRDPSGPVDEGRRIASLIPNAQLAVIQGCGHWPQYDDASTFNRLQLDFLLDPTLGHVPLRRPS